MKNFEKYADVIKSCKDSVELCDKLIKPYILKKNECSGVPCAVCRMIQAVWLNEEYEEPEVDWSEVEVDTPVLVRYSEDTDWQYAHFAKYEDGKVHTWKFGRTSWSMKGNTRGVTTFKWDYAKLASIEE